MYRTFSALKVSSNGLDRSCFAGVYSDPNTVKRIALQQSHQSKYPTSPPHRCDFEIILVARVIAALSVLAGVHDVRCHHPSAEIRCKTYRKFPSRLEYFPVDWNISKWTGIFRSRLEYFEVDWNKELSQDLDSRK